MICATVANVFRDKDKKPIPLSDFMPDWPEIMRGADDGDGS